MLYCQVLLLVSLLFLCPLDCNIHLNGKLFFLIVSISIWQMLVDVFLISLCHEMETSKISLY